MSEIEKENPISSKLKSKPRQRASSAPKVGFVSLGCPKALVDSERIIQQLHREGYQFAADYASADVVVVNTCGFLDSARAESLDAIGEALAENGKVVVTGCLGVDEALIRKHHPHVAAITRPHQYQDVMRAVREVAPMPAKSAKSAIPAMPAAVKPAAQAHPQASSSHSGTIEPLTSPATRLTPPHYAYLKISEGCNNRCSFCIIPRLRGRLDSRPFHDIMEEATALARSGVKELLIISQDTSAYGLDLKYPPAQWRGQAYQTRFQDLAAALGRLAQEMGLWVRLHYVYPYPHVDAVLPLMRDGGLVPYLDIPFQHAAPDILKAMRRPAAQEKTLQRIAKWREICPELTLRSSFIVGFPGETDRDFELLLDWLDEAQLDRVGCFQFEPVAGAAANELPNQVPAEVKAERYAAFMARAEAISARRLQRKIGQRLQVLVDAIDEQGAVCRSYGDAPEIDGQVFIDAEDLPEEGAHALKPGDFVDVIIDEASEHDLWGKPVLSSRA